LIFSLDLVLFFCRKCKIYYVFSLTFLDYMVTMVTMGNKSISDDKIIVKSIPIEVKRKFRAACALRGHTMRQEIINFMEQSGTVSLTGNEKSSISLPKEDTVKD